MRRGMSIICGIRGTKRDDPKCYDLVINVGKTGVQGAVQMILDYIEKKEQSK